MLEQSILAARLEALSAIASKGAQTDNCQSKRKAPRKEVNPRGAVGWDKSTWPRRKENGRDKIAWRKQN